MSEALRSPVPRIAIRTLIAGWLAIGLTACGGGNGGSSPPVQTVPAPATSPTATPAPEVSPTAASTVSLSVSTIAFNGVAQTAGFTAASSTGSALSATAAQPAVATVVPGAQPGQFSVTSVGAGTCTITISDVKGGLATLVVTVTTFPLTVN